MLILKILTLAICFIMLAILKRMQVVLKSRKRKILKGLTLLKEIVKNESKEEAISSIEIIEEYVKDMKLMS